MTAGQEIQQSLSTDLQLIMARSKKSIARILDLENQTYERKPPRPTALGRQGSNGIPNGELTGTQRDFELTEGREEDILGVLKGRVPKQTKARQNIEEKGKGRSDGRTQDFTIPITRERRLATADGRTSFHFSHDAVSKVNKRTVGDDGRVNRPSAAKAHSTYIERTEAVALDEQNRLEVVCATLEIEPLPIDPKKLTGLAADQGIYIERQEALALQPDGSRVLFTNIDDDPEKRAEYWHLVEEHERDAAPDKIIFQISKHPRFWKSAAEQPDCPAGLKHAIETADPAKPVTIKTTDNVAMRAFLAKQLGFIPVPKKRPGEKAKDYQVRCVPAHNLIKFHDGRGGRIQYRIIGELPYELTVAERAAILREFAEEFEKRKLPFVAVMHAPDHTNNDKNWHFHLVYHDRPAKRVTQEMVDAYKFRKGRPTDDLKPGGWDFTILDHEHDKKHRHNRVMFPFRQSKVEEVTQTPKSISVNADTTKVRKPTGPNTWVHRLRHKLADITNGHLECAGVERRVDPRRHEEMGIHSYPQKHLGTRLSNLETFGVATPTGIANEERQWVAIMETLERSLERGIATADKNADRYHSRIDKAAINEDGKNDVHKDVARWHQAQVEAQHYSAIATRLLEHINRARSRASKVAEMTLRNLTAIDAGKTSSYQESRRKQMAQKHQNAQHYLSFLDTYFAEDTLLVRQSLDAANASQAQADRTAEMIKVALDGGLGLNSETKAIPDTTVETAPGAKDAVHSAPSDIVLNKSMMDAWIDGIRRDHRRLVIQGRRVVPMVMLEADVAVIEAPNYNVMAARLSGIKNQQDKIISEIINHIELDPASVRTRTTGDKVGYFLSVSRPPWVQAFNEYQNDPELTKARYSAVARSARLGVDIEGERRRRLVDEPLQHTEPVVGLPKQETQYVQPRQLAAIPVSRAVANAFMDAVINGPIRVKLKDGKAVVSNRTTQFQSALSNVDQNDTDLQNRLIPVAIGQDREIKRVLAYANSKPSRVVEEDGRLVLSTQSPAELVKSSHRWRDDEEVGNQLQAIRTTIIAKTVPHEISENVVREIEKQTTPSLIFQNQTNGHPSSTPATNLSINPKPRLLSLPNCDVLIEEARRYAEAKRALRVEEDRLGLRVGHPKAVQRSNLTPGADLER
jgi:MobA/MobL family